MVKNSFARPWYMVLVSEYAPGAMRASRVELVECVESVTEAREGLQRIAIGLHPCEMASLLMWSGLAGVLHLETYRFSGSSSISPCLELNDGRNPLWGAAVAQGLLAIASVTDPSEADPVDATEGGSY